MNKFTVGSQWTTKGGWRAVVVKVGKIDMLVWHDMINPITYCQNLDGSIINRDYADFTLTTLYTEPRKGTVWVNVWLDESDGEILIYPHETEESRMEDVNGPGSWKLIASFKHDWTENEKV